MAPVACPLADHGTFKKTDGRIMDVCFRRLLRSVSRPLSHTSRSAPRRVVLLHIYMCASFVFLCVQNGGCMGLLLCRLPGVSQNLWPTRHCHTISRTLFASFHREVMSKDTSCFQTFEPRKNKTKQIKFPIFVCGCRMSQLRK